MNEMYPVFEDAMRNIVVYALPLLFGISMHVAAQCYLAHHFGDRTAQMQGRLSLNPMKHIDPIGTIVVPAVCYLLSRLFGVPLIFGYTKPLPIDFGKLRNPKRDMLWVALVGVAANFGMALAWVILGIVFKLTQFQEPFFLQMMEAGVYANLILIGVYLIPLPLFDGGRIVFSLLPNKQAFEYAKIEPYSMLIVIVLLFTRILTNFWLLPWFKLGLIVLNVLLAPFHFSI